MSTAKTITGFIILLLCLCSALPDHAISSSMEWVQIGKPLTPRYGSSICYNPATDSVFLFGGYSVSVEYYETWEWDGVRWNFISTPHMPRDFYGTPVLLYDSLNNRLLLTGYVDPGQQFQIWQLTDNDWTLIDESDSLPLRWVYFLSVYDEERDVICLFGGYTDTSSNDLWEWDHEEWHQIPKSTPWPQGLSLAGLAYNSEIHKVIAFDNYNGQIDPWYWDGSVWEKPEISGPHPTERSGSRIEFDPIRSALVMFGGQSWSEETWEFDGTQWNEVDPPHKPSARSGYAATWDARTNRVMIFGGGNDAGEKFGDTWFYDGLDWTSVAPDPFYPPDLSGPIMAYHPQEQTTLLYGGKEPHGMSTETYLWDRQTWTGKSLPNNPGLIQVHCMAYMASLDGIVLYGGSKQDGPDGFNDKMWLFSDQIWTELTPPVVPGPRHAANMVYDSIRDRIVLFGGVSGYYYDPPYNYDPIWSDETWEYNGNTWYQVFPDHHPPGLWGFGMAFDSCRGVTVLFGGCAESGYSDETWEYNGLDWTRKNPATTSPSRRLNMGFTFDQHRCRVAMHGGVQNLEPGFDETWEWDGYDWYLIEPTGGRAAPYHSTAMIYDSARKCSMIYGGGREGITVETFVYCHSNPDICDQMGVTLDLSQSVFHAGDTFTCTAQVCNNTGDVLTGYPLLVLLDVFSSYFWGPTFTQEFDSYLPQYSSFPEGITDVEVLPSFSWPSNVGSAQGIRFYAALVDPDVHILIGQFDMVEFGWE